MKCAIAALCLVLVGSPCWSQDLSHFQRLLLPVHVAAFDTVPGAGGAEFKTLFDVFAEEGQSYWPAVGPNEFGFIPGGTHYGPLIRGGDTPSSAGRFFFIEHLSQVSFAYHLLSLTFLKSVPVTVLPIVRDSDFSAATIRIGNVPLGDRSGRVKLRVYKRDYTPGSVRVRIVFEDVGGAPLVEKPFVMDISSREGFDASYPYFGSADLETPCRQISFHAPCEGYPAGVEVEPLDAGNYWAFVSYTDNATQQVTTFFPQ